MLKPDYPTVLFFREEGFYPVHLLDPAECGRSIEQQVQNHVELNPGTIKVEDLEVNILFQLQ